MELSQHGGKPISPHYFNTNLAQKEVPGVGEAPGAGGCRACAQGSGPVTQGSAMELSHSGARLEPEESTQKSAA